MQRFESDSELLPSPNPPAVLLSPSKVRSLAQYLMYFPRYPLRTDVFLDLVLHPRLLMNQVGYGSVYLARDIERRKWKHAFEDLINLGSLVPSVVDSAANF